MNIRELGFVSETMLAASIVGQLEEVRILWHRCCSSLIICSGVVSNLIIYLIFFNRYLKVHSVEAECHILVRRQREKCSSARTAEGVTYIRRVCDSTWNMSVARNLNSSVHIVQRKQNWKGTWSSMSY
jgi:hypothetical protein